MTAKEIITMIESLSKIDSNFTVEYVDAESLKDYKWSFFYYLSKKDKDNGFENSLKLLYPQGQFKVGKCIAIRSNNTGFDPTEVRD